MGLAGPTDFSGEPRPEPGLPIGTPLAACPTPTPGALTVPPPDELGCVLAPVVTSLFSCCSFCCACCEGVWLAAGLPDWLVPPVVAAALDPGPPPPPPPPPAYAGAVQARPMVRENAKSLDCMEMLPACERPILILCIRSFEGAGCWIDKPKIRGPPNLSKMDQPRVVVWRRQAASATTFLGRPRNRLRRLQQPLRFGRPSADVQFSLSLTFRAPWREYSPPRFSVELPAQSRSRCSQNTPTP